ncbi:MAG: hypothetical protein U9N77_13790 [Thermodesulfobacteriota bacterium]|nr:hypothetical protein [Thermodesulfobacteriota bacterium]
MFGKKKNKNDALDNPDGTKMSKAEKKAAKQKAKEAKKAAKQKAKEAKKNKKKGIEPGETPKDASTTEEKKKRKFFTLKKLIIILVLFLAVAVSGAVVYKLYFNKGDDKSETVYVKQNLEHINLPDEILKFSFKHFPELYSSFAIFNREIILIDNEISRIDSIGEKYPDQKKIVYKEKKIWGKTREKVFKSFKKIETKVKTLYVLFQVNKAEGIKKIEEQKKDLEMDASEAIIPVAELTKRLKIKKPVPEGLIKGTIFKLKEKFF